MSTSLRMSTEYWEDQEWGLRHYQELVERYPNLWVAIVDRRVVSSGPDPNAVEEEAARKTGRPKEAIPLLFVEAGNQILLA